MEGKMSQITETLIRQVKSEFMYGGNENKCRLFLGIKHVFALDERNGIKWNGLYSLSPTFLSFSPPLALPLCFITFHSDEA